MLKLNKELPNTLSGLIKVALADLEAIENDPRYKVDMEDWHIPEDGVCAVCFAGAVMAQGDADNMKDLTPNNFVERSKLYALNDLRCGELYHAGEGLGRSHADLGSLPDDVEITPYYRDPGQFKEDMKGLAITLEAEGY